MLSAFRTLPLAAWVSGSQNKNSSGTRSGTELLFLMVHGFRPVTDGAGAAVTGRAAAPRRA